MGPAAEGLSAEERCNHSGAGGDDARLLCWNESAMVILQQSGGNQRNMGMGSQCARREALRTMDGEVEAFIRAATAPWAVPPSLLPK